jgi:uncharacterized membrane protein YbhN (UPF0104 family)
MYGSWGHSRSAITLSVLLTGIGNIACKLALPIVALVLLAATGQASAGVIGAALVGLLVLVMVITFAAAGLASERIARTIGRTIGRASGKARRWFRRPVPLDPGIVAMRFRCDAVAVALLRRRGGRLATGLFAQHATQFVLLLVALRAVGVTAGQINWVQALAAYSAASLLTALPVTPGGVSVMELGLAGALIATGGAHAEVVAAVLVYRTVSLLLPLPDGALTYVVWRWAWSQRVVGFEHAYELARERRATVGSA